MRNKFIETILEIMRENERVILLLMGVGRFALRKSFEEFPERAYDLGISEQAIMGMAAGLAKEGLIPVVYGIAPFVVERCYEQIKLDIGFNESKAMIVSVGGSYDYAHEGPTHHCPADVAVLYQVPGINILAPGTAREMVLLLNQAIETEALPCYMRLSEQCNVREYPSWMGKATLVQHGFNGRMVIAVGTSLNAVMEGIGKDASIVYLNSVRPLDKLDLKIKISGASQVMLVEPYYPVLAREIGELVGKAKFKSIGAPLEFAPYGTREELDRHFGLDAEGIRKSFEEFCDD